MQIEVIHTFDYELFFGARSGTPELCLIRPTDLLLRIFNDLKLPGVLFVDLFYLVKLSKETSLPAQRDYEKIVDQLAKAVNQGFEIGVHFHPHWADAIYRRDENEWSFPSYENYTLQRYLSRHSATICDEAMIQAREIYRRGGKPIPEKWCFRAGGWCIEPFGPMRDIFERFKVHSDSSVVPGLRFPDKVQPFDYSGLSFSMKPWRFSSSPTISDLDGKWVEFPVTTFPASRMKRGLRKLSRQRKKTFGDGLSILGSQVALWKKLKNKFISPEIALLTLETEDAIEEGNQFFSSLSDRALLVSVTHPKGLQDSPEIESKIRKSWIAQARAISIQDGLRSVQS